VESMGPQRLQRESRQVRRSGRLEVLFVVEEDEEALSYCLLFAMVMIYVLVLDLRSREKLLFRFN